MTFPEIFARVSTHLVLDADRLRVLYDEAIRCDNLEGDAAELGVYRGGVTAMLAVMMPTKQIFAFDTFSGIPNAVEGIDDHKNGDFGDAGGVVEALSVWKNIVPCVGVFPETAPAGNKRFCLAHFDGDTRASCEAFIDYFEPRMTAGGVMVFDDYSWWRCAGVTACINERFPASRIVNSAKFQCLIRCP